MTKDICLTKKYRFPDYILKITKLHNKPYQLKFVQHKLRKVWMQQLDGNPGVLKFQNGILPVDWEEDGDIRDYLCKILKKRHGNKRIHTTFVMT